MIDPKTLYRLRQPSGKFQPIGSDVFMRSVFVHEPAKEPDNLFAHRGQFYCLNEECDAREVTVALKFLDGLPKQQAHQLSINCPLCGERMEFHNYLNTAMLVPFDGISADIADLHDRVVDNSLGYFLHRGSWERIKASTDIVDVISRDVDLTQSRSKFKGQCPFHEPLAGAKDYFVVDPAKQSFKCWACSKYGDVIMYVQERDKCSFSEAVALLESLQSKNGEVSK